MEKIYIYGNEQSMSWGAAIGELIPLPPMTHNQYAQIHDFVIGSVMRMENNSKIILDLDAADPALALTVALHIRLSAYNLKMKSFCPILLVSNFSLLTFLSLGECSQFFLAQAGYAFCTPFETQFAVKAVTGLDSNTFLTAFLNRIQIRPDETIGTHSMANQWGADVLNRIVSNDDSAETDEIVDAKKKLYYKYVYLNTVPISEIVNDFQRKEYRRNEKCNALQKKILLVDDEASKGWETVMKKWLYGYSVFDTVNQQIKNYDDIPEYIRNNISGDFYDLYLLDLRLLGSQEDDVYDSSEFSGMNVLRSIKEKNIGNQVIIMTASNKAWNMKALLDEGADGYYIKESPELKLPKSFSEANFRSFSRDVRKALDSGYKKEMYRQIVSLKRLITCSTKISGELASEINSTLSSAGNLLQKAKTDNDFAYAFLSLFQVFELICGDYITPDRGNTWIINYDTPLYYYDTDAQTPVRQTVISEEHPSIKRKITGIYIDVCAGTNCKFIRENLFLDIDRRNAFVHNDSSKLSDVKIKKVFHADGFTHLLSTIDVILKGII